MLNQSRTAGVAVFTANLLYRDLGLYQKTWICGSKRKKESKLGKAQFLFILKRLSFFAYIEQKRLLICIIIYL